MSWSPNIEIETVLTHAHTLWNRYRFDPWLPGNRAELGGVSDHLWGVQWFCGLPSALTRRGNRIRYPKPAVGVACAFTNQATGGGTYFGVKVGHGVNSAVMGLQSTGSQIVSFVHVINRCGEIRRLGLFSSIRCSQCNVLKTKQLFNRVMHNSWLGRRNSCEHKQFNGRSGCCCQHWGSLWLV